MWDKVGTNNWRRPLLLRPDNFTPPSRTPWGGRRIGELLKADADLGPLGPVGEAWELSVEPDFPSRLAEGPLLDEVLRADPALLGAEAPDGSTSLLVKLIDAADNLSVQIHPRDDDPELGADESGKPEAWYIVDAEPGAGLYLGFEDGVSRQQVEATIESGGDVDDLMTFVPVSPGDLFLIEPGTPHAVGKGVFLLEPQRVAPGKRGITYRYWDWNRNYDSAGNLDPNGRPRALHLQRALAVTRWNGPNGEALLEQIHRRAGPAEADRTARLETLVSKEGPLRSNVFALHRLTGSGSIELGTHDRLRALTILEGRVGLHQGGSTLALRRGQTAALPACLDPLQIDLDAAHALVSTLA
ncbi:MAG: type I phosphomannose isomerase catalytic subunit [Polyangiales bacterium]